MRSKRNPLLVGSCAILTMAADPAAAEAQGSQVTSPVELAEHVDALEPGEWVWAPNIAPHGPVLVFVDLTEQMAIVYRDGVRIGATTVSTGRPGHETPTGVFTILQKDADHHSSIYNNASMPFTQRLTWSGVALHAGGLPGYPESHGCVHLPLEFARLLFEITDLGATVVVAGEAGSTLRTHAGGMLAPGVVPDSLPRHFHLEDGVQYEWQPEISPDGPVTIVASHGDQTIVVLRNGVEIGRSPVAFPHYDFLTHVLTLVEDEAGMPYWIFADVPGHAAEDGHVVDASVADRLRMPRGFRRHLGDVLEPGTTIVLTASPISEESTGPELAVLNGVEPGHFE